MQQLLAIIQKDLKMLLRSKSSTMAVLLGPLILVLLIGLVFSNADSPEITLGVVHATFENSAKYTASLESAFTIIDYNLAEECSLAVQQGKIVSCVVFKPGDPPQALIYVDPSDVNVVYAVIDQITGQIDNQTSQLRQGLADELLTAVTQTRVTLDQDYELLRESFVTYDEQEGKAADLARGLQDVRIDVQIVSVNEVANAIDNSVNARDDYQRIAQAAIQGYIDLSEEDNESSDYSRARELETEYDFVTDELNNDADRIFAKLLDSLRGMNNEIDASSEKAQALSSQATNMRNSLRTANTDIEQVITDISKARNGLSGLDISSQDLTSPITPIIEPVIAESDSFLFSFPYFITLIIMFTGILLAAGIVVRERRSNAYFRNFTTPTPDWMFVISTYFSTISVLLLQLIIIFVVSAMLISVSVTSNIGMSILILVLIVTFFSLLGMLLGYIFRSQEGVMLAAIAIASLLLFSSSLVLPVQTMPYAAQFILNANPFVLASELLKAALIFNFGFAQVGALLGVLFLYCLVLFAAIMIVQRLARIRYFEVQGTSGRISEFLGDQEISEEKALDLGNWKVYNKAELLQALTKMSDDEYERFATHRRNDFSQWVLDVYKDEDLARQLKNKSRKGAIAVLEKEAK